MKIFKNIQLIGADERPFLADVYRPDNQDIVPTIIFAHGFKGFKDWGCWHWIAAEFVKAGFAFISFNFSHNGTTPEHPTDFADLAAFGNNTYSREWFDLDVMLDWVAQSAKHFHLNLDSLTLIGHSRGGGIAIAKSAENQRIKNLVTWASVSSLAWLWADEALKNQWRQNGVIYQVNARTNQNMPLYYTLCEDYEAHRSRFDLAQAAPKVTQNWLIVHGSADVSVPLLAAELLHSYQPKSTLHLIEGADHTFGARHPNNAITIPEHSLALVKVTIDFLKNT